MELKKIIIIVVIHFLASHINGQNWNWVKTIKGNNGFQPVVYDISADKLGNSYVVGMGTGPTTFDSYILPNPWFCGIVAKYDISGNFKWANRAGDFMNATTTDRFGNVYIAGTIAAQNFNNQYNLFTSTNQDSVVMLSRGEFDVAIAKYDQNGGLLWVRSAGSSSWDEANSIAVDKDGNCYVTGFYKDTANFGNLILPYQKSQATTYRPTRFFITKLNPSGDFMWAKYGFGPENDYSYVVGNSVNINVDGSVFLTGSFMGGLDLGEGKILTGQGAFIGKYSSTGNLMWVKQIDEADNINIVSDKIGNCYVTGGKYLNKYDSQGNQLYSKTIIASANQNNGNIAFLTIDTVNTKLFIGGAFSNIPTTFGQGSYSITLTASKTAGDAFVAGFDTDGNLKWVTSPTGGWQGNTGARGVATDNNGNCFVTGNFGGAGATNFGNIHFNDITPSNIYVAKIGVPAVTKITTHYLKPAIFSLFPNPTSGEIEINFSPNQHSDVTLTIYTSHGQKVYTEKFISSSKEHNQHIDLSEYSKGMYLIEILADGKKEMQKIVVQ